MFLSVDIPYNIFFVCSWTSEVFKLELNTLDKYYTGHSAWEWPWDFHKVTFSRDEIHYSLLDMLMDFSGAQTELSEQGYSHPYWQCLYTNWVVHASTYSMQLSMHRHERQLWTKLSFLEWTYIKQLSVHVHGLRTCTNWCYQAWTYFTISSAHVYISFQSINLCFLEWRYFTKFCAYAHGPQNYLNWSFIVWTSIAQCTDH